MKGNKSKLDFAVKGNTSMSLPDNLDRCDSKNSRNHPQNYWAVKAFCVAIRTFVYNNCSSFREEIKIHSLLKCSSKNNLRTITT